MFARLCVPFPNYNKITGYDLIRIQGGCSYGCFNDLLTYYSFRVFGNTVDFDFEFTHIIWKELDMKSGFFSCTILFTHSHMNFFMILIKKKNKKIAQLTTLIFQAFFLIHL
jgi:hypothetical protein